MREVSVPQERDRLLISKDIFRAYDIRGKYPEEINSTVFNQIGLALGTKIISKNSDPVIICRDGRTSSKELADSLVEALIKCGIEVIDIGTLPTPLMNFSLHKSKIKNGLMITGSHNPKNYNGVKMVVDNLTIYGEHIEELYDIIEKRDYIKSNNKGSYLQDKTIADDYIKYVSENIEIKTNLKVVVDCGNGITGPLINNICKSFDLNHKIINETVDGTFPSHPPDPTNPENLHQIREALRESKADLGVAFDGDGDRMILIKNDGEIIWPDQLMIIFSTQILKSKKGKIVYDIKCSKYLNDSILENGGEPIISRTGHSFIKKSMKENNAILGGEMSGHIFFNDKWFGFDDGVYAFLRIMELLRDKKDYDKIFNNLPQSVTTPEIAIQFKENNHFTFMDKFVKLAVFDDCQTIDIDGLKVIYDDCWGLIRCSNTTSCVVLRFEADDENSMNRIKSKFRDAMLKIDKDLEIPF